MSTHLSFPFLFFLGKTSLGLEHKLRLVKSIVITVFDNTLHRFSHNNLSKRYKEAKDRLGMAEEFHSTLLEITVKEGLLHENETVHFQGWAYHVHCVQDADLC